ncbi:unnamed protein product [Fraxinus pennsylvanica]|uniref:Morc S5 domain-containing protein n=1 Tax=Fraxinus pennsylvanica TaxID=56036 RepID=A0AAD2A282_9LAMI|nr:unnamed protein product [Fraxinus pennsylvanica]
MKEEDKNGIRIPPSFRIVLRGKDIEHHNIVNDMMMSQEVAYHLQPGTDGVPKDANMQKTYWSSNCHHISYSLRRNKKAYERESSPDSYSPTHQSKKNVTSSSSKMPIKSVYKGHNKWHMYEKEDMKKKASGKRPSYSGLSSSGEDVSYNDVQTNIRRN